MIEMRIFWDLRWSKQWKIKISIVQEQCFPIRERVAQVTWTIEFYRCQRRKTLSPTYNLSQLFTLIVFVHLFFDCQSKCHSIRLLTSKKDKQMTFKEAKTLTKQTTIGLFEVMAFFESCHTNDSSLRSFFISREGSQSV